MSALVADCYDTLTRSRQSRGGREDGREDGREPVSPAGGFETGGVFLLGDAAHQFPPAGGFGLNTGVQVWLCDTCDVAMVWRGVHLECREIGRLTIWACGSSGVGSHATQSTTVSLFPVFSKR